MTNAGTDSLTTISELKARVRLFCDERWTTRQHNAKSLAIGIITEAAELLQILRFVDDSEVDQKMGEPGVRQEVVAELSDIVLFVIRLALNYNIDLTESCLCKLEDLEKRIVPHSSSSN